MTPSTVRAPELWQSTAGRSRPEKTDLDLGPLSAPAALPGPGDSTAHQHMLANRSGDARSDMAEVRSRRIPWLNRPRP